MKHAKLHAVTFLLLLFALLITACAPANSGAASKDNYAVYLDSSLQSSTNTLVSNANSYSFQKIGTTTPAETTKTVTMNGETYTLHYKESKIHSRNQEIYIYESEDKNLSFRYFAHNLQLMDIFLRNQDMSVFENMTQAEYEAWIRQFVSQYYSENWEEYEISYQTEYKTSDGKFKVKQEFLAAPPEEAEISYRMFMYQKHYQGFGTEDIVCARLYFEECMIDIVFNPYLFENYTADIDVEKMQTAITDYVKANLHNNATLQDIGFENGELRYIDGNYLCSWQVNTKVLAETGSVVDDSFYVLVDIPDA